MSARLEPALVAVMVPLACWEGWRWTLARIAASPEEGLALAMTVGLVAIEAARGLGVAAPGAASATPTPVRSIPYAALALLLMAYAAALASAPSIITGAIAVAASLFAVYRIGVGIAPPPAFWGLAALSLPVLPSLQFVLGYPMRLVSATLTVALLELQGHAIAREGTHLHFAGQSVQFDAPCSGVNMLWAAIMLALLACHWWRLGWLATLLAVGLSLVLAVVANVLRASSLFYVEIGALGAAPEWLHGAIGVAAFAMSAGLILPLLLSLRHAQTKAWRSAWR